MRVGLFTSPHLRFAKERIRINGKCLEDSLFVKYFDETWVRLQLDDKRAPIPGYFCFMTLLAFHVFLMEKVDAVVLEVGIGGLFDCTNVIKRPIACAIAAIGYDHVKILGPTIEEIALNKAGIIKVRVHAFVGCLLFACY